MEILLMGGNWLRAYRGKPYYSLSQKVKHRVKSAVSYISDFENELVRLAEIRHLDGVICGHIHQAADTCQIPLDLCTC